MTEETSVDSIPDDTDPWEALLEDATTIESEFQTAGWETVFLEPEVVRPIESQNRVGFRARVAASEYRTVADLLERSDVSFDAVDVYYQTAGQTTVVLAVERDDASEHAVLLPFSYEIPDASEMFETALEVGQLHVTLESDAKEQTDEEIVFSHEDPSLFLEESTGLGEK